MLNPITTYVLFESPTLGGDYATLRPCGLFGATFLISTQINTALLTSDNSGCYTLGFSAASQYKSTGQQPVYQYVAIQSA